MAVSPRWPQQTITSANPLNRAQQDFFGGMMLVARWWHFWQSSHQLEALWGTAGEVQPHQDFPAAVERRRPVSISYRRRPFKTHHGRPLQSGRYCRCSPTGTASLVLTPLNVAMLIAYMAFPNRNGSLWQHRIMHFDNNAREMDG